MPPPHNGNESKSFVDLLKLEKLNDTTFRSTALAFAPGGRHPRAVGVTYGGHVFSQAAWAACQTVKEGLLLYNISGHFILPGRPESRSTYTVQEIRDGRSSAIRIVHATQPSEKDSRSAKESNEKLCFTCTVSFRREETSVLSMQVNDDLWETYPYVLRNRRPSEFPSVPGMDVPWYHEYLQSGGQEEDFPGLEMTQVPMDAFNASRHPLDRRLLMFYRPIGDIPSDQPNLHLCAHLYASDRNGLYILAGFLEIGDLYTQMGSLAHTVVFHAPVKQLMFGTSASAELEDRLSETEGSGRWFGWEIRMDRMEGNRMSMHSRIWGPGRNHAGTVMQDGMTRVSEKAVATEEEAVAVRQRMANWKKREKL